MNEMSGDLPSPLLITKNFVATSGEEEFHHKKKKNSEPKVSLQEAGRALAIGPHRSILTVSLFLFVLRMRLVETNSFRLMKRLLQSSHSFPSFFSLRIERTKFTYSRVRKKNQQETSHFLCPAILLV